MKKGLLTAILLFCALVAGVLAGMLLAGSGNNFFGGSESQKAGDKLSRTMSQVGSMYVDSVDMNRLSEVAIAKILQELDPHSVYIPAQDLPAVNESMEGEFDGVGLVFSMPTDTAQVINVVPTGPSFKAGVQAGDRIITIDDSLVAGKMIPMNEMAKRLRGRRGSKVRLGLARQGVPEPVEIEVTRGIIPIKVIDAAFMIAPEVGFVRLSQFSKHSFVELQKALVELYGQGMKKLILDLRDNTGGFLDQAVNIANLFLDAGDPIVSTWYRAGNLREEVKSNGLGGFSSLPLAVLINEGSASSSEILAGAIQDNDRGVIVGRRSVGKGLMQTDLPYSDGSVLRLTVGRYFTPSGRSIQGAYDLTPGLMYRQTDGRYVSVDSLRADTMRYFTLEKGREMHAGGGIMPDRVVETDTPVVGNEYYLKVYWYGFFYRFALEWSDRHRAQVNAVQSVEQLDAMLDREGSRLVDEFVAFAAKAGVKPVSREIATARKVIEAHIRANIGSNTPLEYTGFFAEISKVDNAAKAAIEALNEQES